MDDDSISDQYLRAMEAYRSGDFDLATELFSQLAFKAWLEESTEVDPIEAMEMTINSFKNLDPSVSFTHEPDLIERYLMVLRHFFDTREISDSNLIEQEIGRIIPMSGAEYRDYRFEEGVVETDRTIIDKYPVSIISAQGPRDEMEDAYLFGQFSHLSHSFVYFSLFDGHGGAACVHYVVDSFEKMLVKQIKESEEVVDIALYNALCRTFVQLDYDWKDLPVQKKHFYDRSGTAAISGLIDNDQYLWVACVGDSRAVLNDNGVAVQLSEDAKPYVTRYYDEIWFRGGSVLWDRVDGGLALARAIGDICHPSVSARPTLKKIKLSDDRPQQLILACDGLWDVVDPQQAVDTIDGIDPEEAVQRLKDLAFTKGTWDNVTIMLITLTGDR